MTLCLDIGNSQIFGGVYKEEELLFTFRKVSGKGDSSDELGLFLCGVLRENGYSPEAVRHFAFCSVYPGLNHALVNCSRRYFKTEPFSLTGETTAGLTIEYNNPKELGADRLANAIGGTSLFPGKNLIIIDFGTATTFCAITADRRYLGGAIFPGIKLAMESLEQNTAKLPRVEILAPRTACGQTTTANIQSGLYYSCIGTVKELSRRITRECFPGQEKPLLIGTGGFSGLFRQENLFDKHIPGLVLTGLYRAHRCKLTQNAS